MTENLPESHINIKSRTTLTAVLHLIVTVMCMRTMISVRQVSAAYCILIIALKF